MNFIAFIVETLVHPRWCTLPRSWILSSFLNCILLSISIAKEYSTTGRTKPWHNKIQMYSSQWLAAITLIKTFPRPHNSVIKMIFESKAPVKNSIAKSRNKKILSKYEIIHSLLILILLTYAHINGFWKQEMNKVLADIFRHSLQVQLSSNYTIIYQFQAFHLYVLFIHKQQCGWIEKKNFLKYVTKNTALHQFSCIDV